MNLSFSGNSVYNFRDNWLSALDLVKFNIMNKRIMYNIPVEYKLQDLEEVTVFIVNFFYYSRIRDSLLPRISLTEKLVIIVNKEHMECHIFKHFIFNSNHE